MWSSRSRWTRRFTRNVPTGRGSTGFRRGAALSLGSQFRKLTRRNPKGPSARGPLRAQVASLRNVVRKNIPEMKYIDNTLDQTNITTTGSVSSCALVATGTGPDERIGAEINVQVMSAHGVFRSLATNSYYRVAVVVDTQQIADTQPTAADIFQDADPVDGLPDLNTQDRFRWLYVSDIISGSQYNLSGTGNIVSWFWSGSLKVSFNGDANTDVQKNQVYFVIITDDTANVVDFEGVFRIGFTDS